MINKFLKVENFLTKDELTLLKEYTFIAHRINFNRFDFQNGADSGFYGDGIMESLMTIKKDKINELTSKKLSPTYSFWRMYTAFSVLDRHKDRPSCEYSCTIQISSDGTEWPIYMDGQELTLRDGDAVIYKGCEVEHWRNEFKGDYQAQCFLHYVDSEGPFKEHIFDNRQLLGLAKT